MLLRAGDLEILYTSRGVMKDEFLEGFVGIQRYFAIHYYARESVVAQGAVFVATALAALSLLVGFKTRSATILTWYFMVSLYAFNPMVIHSGDATLRLMLFWSIFLPLGARWSLDSRRAGETFVADNAFRSVATLALLLQTCFIYWFTCLLKAHPIWLNGEAVYYAMNIDLFATQGGLWLRDQPWLHEPLTYATLIIELLFPILAFVPRWTGPIRCIVILSFVGLHASFGLTFNLGTFAFISMISWVPFIPTWFWEKLPLQRSSQPRDSAKTTRLREHWFVSVFCAGLLFYVFLINCGTTKLPGTRILRSSLFMAPAKMLRIHQRWAMFAPHPKILDAWTMFHATLDDGSTIDLLDQTRPPTLEKPPRVTAMYPNIRWSLVILYFSSHKRWGALEYVAEGLGDCWRDTTSDDPRAIKTVDLHFIFEPTPPPDSLRQAVTRPIHILSYDFAQRRTAMLADPVEVDAQLRRVQPQ